MYYRYAVSFRFLFSDRLIFTVHVTLVFFFPTRSKIEDPRELAPEIGDSIFECLRGRKTSRRQQKTASGSGTGGIGCLESRRNVRRYVKCMQMTERIHGGYGIGKRKSVATSRWLILLVNIDTAPRKLHAASRSRLPWSDHVYVSS